jgi:hypothetical protein
MISLGDHATPRVISSTILGLIEMSILIVGEIITIFQSLKASCSRIGFLNKPTWPRGMKSLDSMVQTGASECGLKEL